MTAEATVHEQAAVQAELLNLASVVEQGISFSIPSYQRPYVWSQDDAARLWDDIVNAYKASESEYFIGTTLSARVTAKEKEPEDKSSVYELIDGQQRTTTLTLIALAFRAAGVECDLEKAAVIEKKPRLTFEIRESVQNLVGSAAGLEVTKPGIDAIDSDEYLRHIHANLKFFIQKVQGLKKGGFEKSDETDSGDAHAEVTARALANYIYRQVHWVNNIVPQNLDLNRLFASMNTAGIQLEPVDLLKAKLFKKIKTEKALYSLIWQACEHQDNYFERNLRQLFPNADWNTIEYKDLSKFRREFFVASEGADGQHGTDNSSSMSLLELFEDATKLAATTERRDNSQKPGSSFETAQGEHISGKNSDDTEDGVALDKEGDKAAVYCEAIVSFELLLIHTLRIFCACNDRPDLEPRIKAGNLMACFEVLVDSPEAEIKAFVELLWQVRYQFDTWVVKWVEHTDRNDRQLRLTNLSRSKSSGKFYISRSIRDVGLLAQLQSVLNFTGDRSAQYWLTALLAQLVAAPEQSYEQVVQLLESIDNQLSLAEDTQKVASFTLAKGLPVDVKNWASQEEYLSESKGTSFEHYWFQKLEYVLWKAAIEEESGDLDRIRRYRITSKNSVEHVHPQHEEFKRKLGGEGDPLNAFGNLVLLSPGENSSYGNQTVGKKMDDFINKPGIDSMKLRQIYRAYEEAGRTWNTEQVEKHQRKMLKLLCEHYKSGSIDGQ
jgi:uncharacterized protein with ParB-like and HNH nuclease domain